MAGSRQTDRERAKELLASFGIQFIEHDYGDQGIELEFVYDEAKAHFYYPTSLEFAADGAFERFSSHCT